MFAHYAVRRNITYGVNIIAVRYTSLARMGKHRSADLLYRRSPLCAPFYAFKTISASFCKIYILEFVRNAHSLDLTR